MNRKFAVASLCSLLLSRISLYFAVNPSLDGFQVEIENAPRSPGGTVS